MNLSFLQTEQVHKLDLSTLKTYGTTTHQVGAHTFTIDIIGLSHHISCKNFHELLSCVTLPGAKTIPLEIGFKQKQTFTGKQFTLHTTITVESLVAIEQVKQESDIFHAFSEKEVTGIVLEEKGYTTYHTYPEKGVLVVSKTRL